MPTASRRCPSLQPRGTSSPSDALPCRSGRRGFLYSTQCTTNHGRIRNPQVRPRVHQDRHLRRHLLPPLRRPEQSHSRRVLGPATAGAYPSPTRITSCPGNTTVVSAKSTWTPQSSVVTTARTRSATTSHPRITKAASSIGLTASVSRRTDPPSRMRLQIRQG